MPHQIKVFKGSQNLCACGWRTRKTSPRRRFAPGHNTDSKTRAKVFRGGTKERWAGSDRPTPPTRKVVVRQAPTITERGHGCGIEVLTPRERGVIHRWSQTGTVGFVTRSCGCYLKVVPREATFQFGKGDEVVVTGFSKDTAQRKDGNQNFWVAREIAHIEGDDDAYND